MYQRDKSTVWWSGDLVRLSLQILKIHACIIFIH